MDPSLPKVDDSGVQLLKHARVYTIAEKFGVPFLKNLASSKIHCVNSTAKGEIAYARYVYEFTSGEDTTIRAPVANFWATRSHTLRSEAEEEFRRLCLEFPQFGYDVLSRSSPVALIGFGSGVANKSQLASSTKNLNAKGTRDFTPPPPPPARESGPDTAERPPNMEARYILQWRVLHKGHLAFDRPAANGGVLGTQRRGFLSSQANWVTPRSVKYIHLASSCQGNFRFIGWAGKWPRMYNRKLGVRFNTANGIDWAGNVRVRNG